MGCESGVREWDASVVQEWEWVERVQCENEMRVANRKSEKVGLESKMSELGEIVVCKSGKRK